MFFRCTNLAGGNGTAYNSSNADSWKTILNAVKNNNILKYKVGDTKTIDLGTTYGTHTIRISNTKTPSECSTSGFSQSACGFVIDFADLIADHKMNDKAINTGGLPSSAMRTVVVVEHIQVIVQVEHTKLAQHLE